MVSGWIKYFKDGTLEDGIDLMVSKEERSWSKGRLTEIEKVSICDGINLCSLDIPDTAWHQFDRFAIKMVKGVHKPVRTCRAIQALIRNDHINNNIFYFQTLTSSTWIVTSESLEDITRYTNTYYPPSKIGHIADTHVGKWISVIMPVNNLVYLSICEKGKLNAI